MHFIKMDAQGKQFIAAFFFELENFSRGTSDFGTGSIFHSSYSIEVEEMALTKNGSGTGCAQG
jgi:hypothetical protein